MVGGVAQGANGAIDVTAAQLAGTTFQSGSGSDDLWVRANDGIAWGAWKEFHVNAPVDHCRSRRRRTTPPLTDRTLRRAACSA